MKRSIAGLLALALLGVACGSKDKKDGGDASSDAPLPAFTGPLTSRLILDSKDLVKPFDPWDRGLAKLESKLGKATRVKDDTKYQWAVIEGDACTYAEVEKEDRGKYQKGDTGWMVGAVTHPMKVDTSGPSGNYAECREIAGVTGGPPEDPKAPGPPPDGSAVPLQTFIDVAVSARSKWDKKRIKVEARLSQVGVSSWTSGDKQGETTTVLLVVSKEKTDQNVHCTLRAGEKKPEAPDGKPFAGVVAEGTVKIEKWMNLAGDTGLTASLEDCTLTFVK